MPISPRENRVIKQVIKAHGPTLDLDAQPELLVEIIRKWGIDLMEEIPDAGVVAGVKPVGPTSLGGGPGLDDVLKELIALRRQVEKLGRQSGR
jgi:hypothetical protein